MRHFFKQTLLFLVIAFTSYFGINAQVTVGLDKTPPDGAIFQMKQFETSSSKSDGKSTSEKGMIMPRVALQDLNLLEPCSSTTTSNKELHRGMMVYNTTINSSKNLEEGTYFFDGTKWVRAITTLPSTATNTEPWRKMGTTTEATAPADNMYVTGNVNIGSQTAQSAYKLQVTGHSNVTGNARVAGTSTVGSNSYIGGYQTIGNRLGIGTTSPNASASLDLASTSRALKLNIVNLTSTTDVATVNTPVAGMLVYNASTVSDVTPGTYFYNGSKWVRTITALPSTATNTEPWRKMGTTTEATAPADNIYVTGNVNIGASTAQSTYKLQVTGHSNVTGNARVAGTSTVVSNSNIGGYETIGDRLGIGTASPNTSASLDLASTSRALKLNNVKLTSTTDVVTVKTPVVGMTVYNTNTVADVKPGIYYYDGTKWKRVSDYEGSAVNLRNLKANVTTTLSQTPGHAPSAALIDMGELILPETGSYAFTFRLYGSINTSAIKGSFPKRSVYYMYLLSNGVIVDAAEIDLIVIGGTAYSYSITLTCSSTVGSNITFRLAHHNANESGPWTLVASSNNANPVRTSMVWWKL